MPKTYLFVHQNFPGQFVHLARALAARGDRVIAIGETLRLRERANPHPSIKRIGYTVPAAESRAHPYLRGLEAHTRRGQAVFRVARELAQKGLRPDVVLAHPGWGEALFLRDVFPAARHVQYLEFFYRADGADVGFDPEFPAALDDRLKLRLKNATQLVSFEAADVGVAPTAWQQSRYPADWQGRIVRIHDGIDTGVALPDPHAKVSFGGTVFGADDEVVTYVARNLEPYRGFHTLMRAIPALLERRPRAQIVVVGADGVSYGRAAPDGGSFREHYVAEWKDDVDRGRVHFLGRVSYRDYLRVLQVSSLHIYLTYPFVLSWSMLEAMSAGCIVLGSNTAPVTEAVHDGENGFLTGFFDAQALANRACELLGTRGDLSAVRQRARETILSGYDLHGKCLPAMVELVDG